MECKESRQPDLLHPGFQESSGTIDIPPMDPRVYFARPSVLFPSETHTFQKATHLAFDKPRRPLVKRLAPYSRRKSNKRFIISVLKDLAGLIGLIPRQKVRRKSPLTNSYIQYIVLTI
jgi:hypothetical protein